MALLPLLIALTRASAISFSHPRPRSFRIFLLGEITGVVYLTGTLYWLTDTMVTFGGLAWILAFIAAEILIFYLALFPALFGLAFAFARRRLGIGALLLTPFIWVATELGRTYLLTGFPWVLLGYSQMPLLSLLQAASLFGIYVISFIVASTSAVIAYCLYERNNIARIASIATVAVMIVVAMLWGHARLEQNALLQPGHGQPIRVGVVQGNVPQTEKWDDSLAARTFRRYLAMSRQAAAQGAQLIIWPEASLPYYYEREPIIANAIGLVARETNTYMLFGSDQIDTDTPPHYFNAAFLVNPAGRPIGSYRKMHLVPFGEYVPFERYLYFVTPIVKSAFNAGDRVEILHVGDHTLSTMICYEAVFPDLGLQAVQAGSQLLTTITNDAWYGTSSAPFQHFEQARMRAIEQGRYLVRAANTGISGVVDPYGRIVQQSNLFEPAVLTTEVRFIEDRTLYARIGNAFAYACVLITVLPATIRRRA